VTPTRSTRGIGTSRWFIHDGRYHQHATPIQVPPYTTSQLRTFQTAATVDPSTASSDYQRPSLHAQGAISLQAATPLADLNHSSPGHRSAVSRHQPQVARCLRNQRGYRPPTSRAPPQAPHKPSRVFTERVARTAANERANWSETSSWLHCWNVRVNRSVVSSWLRRLSCMFLRLWISSWLRRPSCGFLRLFVLRWNPLCGSQRTAKETARNDSCVVKIVGYRCNRVVTSIPNLVTCGRFLWKAPTVATKLRNS
jgi:hypothetical protein